MKKALIIVDARPLIALATTDSLNALLLAWCQGYGPRHGKICHYWTCRQANRQQGTGLAWRTGAQYRDNWRISWVWNHTQREVGAKNRVSGRTGSRWYFGGRASKRHWWSNAAVRRKPFRKTSKLSATFTCQRTPLSVSMLLETETARPEAHQEFSQERLSKVNTAFSKTAKKRPVGLVLAIPNMCA